MTEGRGTGGAALRSITTVGHGRPLGPTKGTAVQQTLILINKYCLTDCLCLGRAIPTIYDTLSVKILDSAVQRSRPT